MNQEKDEPLKGGEHEKGHKGPDEHNEHHHGDERHHHDDGVVIRWKLNVQGVVIESPHPKIEVRHAIKEAGFNPETPWIIILKVAGETKKEVELSFVIDLRHEGIEMLRLTPRQINNGEMTAKQRIDFALLP